MFAHETQILQGLAVLVVCHDLAVGQIISSHYILLRRLMPWVKAREFCQRHYVDLAVLSSEEQYLTLQNATAANKASFWLGLQRQSTFSDWRWVNGEELTYNRWYRRNPEVRCASLEAMLKKDNKLLARNCDEMHMFSCQGPVSPQTVTVDPVSSDHVILSWNVSTFMQMTPHCYYVTTCNDTCDTLILPYTDGFAFMSINISNLTSATEYTVEISAHVLRPDNVTGRKTRLQSKPTALQIRTADSGGQPKVIIVILKWLKLVFLIPPLWILCHISKDCKSPCLCEFIQSDHDTLPEELSTEEMIAELIPAKTRGVG